MDQYGSLLIISSSHSPAVSRACVKGKGGGKGIDHRMTSGYLESFASLLLQNFANKDGIKQIVRVISIMYVAIIVIIAQVVGN